MKVCQGVNLSVKQRQRDGKRTMDFSSNGLSEIRFVDGAEHALSSLHKEALTSASAHFLESFGISHEVDVYISKRSVLQGIGSSARAWHMPPSFDRDNSLVCVFIDPTSKIEQNIVSLAHEMIHAWQVDRGDLVGHTWKGMNLEELPYQLQPWEIEAHGHMGEIAEHFFDDLLPTKAYLQKIQEDTDSVFAEIVETANVARMKENFKKIGKVAAAVGLGALIGF